MLAARRQLSSVMKVWAFRKQLRLMPHKKCDRSRATSIISQFDCLLLQNTVSGVRCNSCSHRLLHTGSENVEEDVRTTQRSKHRSLPFQKKLHNRVFSEQDVVDDQQFETQNFLSETEADTFGSLQHREKREPEFSSTSDFKNTYEKAEYHPTEPATILWEKEFIEHVPAPEEHFTRSTKKRNHVKRVVSWSDEFGTLGEDSIAERIEESLTTGVGSHEERFSDDEDDEDSNRIRLSSVGRRRIPEWYGMKILRLGKRGQVKEAIEVFDDWMLKQDRVMPNSYVFTCLLTVLGRAGYTKKAFSLFRKMRSMGIQPKPATYTALFNACANSPWKKDGQTRAESLLRVMKEKEIKPTFITGKVMVKAFAMCGDLRRAFSLVDELSRMYRPDPEIFSFLLMACISDKEAGLRHAIQVWRVMQQMKIRPDLPLYNLLLRCVRDCGVGDMSSFTLLLTGNSTAASTQQSNLLHSGSKTDACEEVHFKEEKQEAKFTSGSLTQEQTSPESEPLETEHQAKEYSQFRHQEMREVIPQLEVQNSHPSSSLTVPSSVAIPDVLFPGQHDSRIVSLGDLSTKENRLLLLGGVDGILSRMAKDRARPDVITFTQLMSVAQPTVEAEQQLMDVMRSMRVKPDIDFINNLIHKRCMRFDFNAAKAVREIVQKHGLTCNQMTYGVLAMTCKTLKDAAQLLEEMEAADMAPNMEILGTLVFASGMKFGYKLWVLRQVQRRDLQPNAKFLQNVENGLAIVRRKIIQAERQGQTDSYLLSPTFQQSVETFTQHYEAWLKQTKVQNPDHPWANFRSPSLDYEDTAVKT